MKTVIIPGAFDPPHYGHLHLIKNFCKGDSKVVIFPMENGLFPKKPVASLKHRMEMLLLLLGCVEYGISDKIVILHSTSDAGLYHTMKSVFNEYKNDVSVVIGREKLSLFRRIRNSRKLYREFGVELFIHPRCKDIMRSAKYRKGSIFMTCKRSIGDSTPSSSKSLRNCNDRSELLLHVPQELADYIVENKLYGFGEQNKDNEIVQGEHIS